MTESVAVDNTTELEFLVWDCEMNESRAIASTSRQESRATRQSATTDA